MCDETIQRAKARRAVTGRALAVPFLVCVMFSQNVKSEIPRGERNEWSRKICGCPMPAHSGQLSMLIREALENNPRKSGTRCVRARQPAHRVSPAEALDEPVLEAGVISVPWPRSLQPEDTTMKMIDTIPTSPVSRKTRFCAKDAAKDAEAIGHGYRRA
jgi:hypothetical protein